MCKTNIICVRVWSGVGALHFSWVGMSRAELFLFLLVLFCFVGKVRSRNWNHKNFEGLWIMLQLGIKRIMRVAQKGDLHHQIYQYHLFRWAPPPSVEYWHRFHASLEIYTPDIHVWIVENFLRGSKNFKLISPNSLCVKVWSKWHRDSMLHL